MKGTLAELHNHIMRKFEFFSNDVFRLLEEVSKDKGETLFPRLHGNPDSMAHLAQKAKPLQREIMEQEKHEQKLREKAEQQREEERKHRLDLFQSPGPQFDQDLQNSIKGVRIDSSVPLPLLPWQ